MKFTLVAAALALAGFTQAAMPVGQNPHTLESRATRSSIGWYSYGCYMDCYNGMNRFLPHLAYRDSSRLSPDDCIASCKGAGFNYAGLQFGEECWCGPELAGPPIFPEACDFRCNDGAHCGGGCRNNVWSAFEKPGH